MLGLQLESKQIFNDILSILVCTLQRLAPRLQNGIKGLICVLLFVMARSLVYFIEDRVSCTQSLHELDWWV